METTQLSPLPADFGRVLAVVAHPDDLEFGASAAIARWVGEGKHVVELLVTRGEAGIDTVEPERCAPLREAEQRAAAAAVGVRDVEFLDFADGSLEYGLALRRELSRAVRTHRPEAIVSLNFRESFGPGAGFNHADHRVLGPALLDAVRDADNRWVFPELIDEGLQPWRGVGFVAFSNSLYNTHFVEITEEQLAAGIASLSAHEVYLANLSGFDQKSFLRDNAERQGRECGVPLATTFELIPA